jgi:hypothetical protein
MITNKQYEDFMRQDFIEGNKAEAMDKCPWATWVVKCEGGYRCFECANDYLLFMDGSLDKKHKVR